MKKIYKDEYPVREIVCDDTNGTGIRLLSIVEEPAIEMMGVAFNKDNMTKDFQFKAQEDKQIIVGPAMIPDIKILRKDENGEMYYNVFKKDTILKLVQKFNSSGTNRRVNVDHSSKMVDGYIMENWIVEDPYYDKSKMYGLNVPVGTWMVSIKVDDKEFWKTDVKELGKFGFSIEGVMGEKPLEYNIEKFVIEKKSGETKNEFISRCISIEVANGHPQDQSVAMCISQWENYEKVEMESVIDELNGNEIDEILTSFKKWRSSPDSSNVDKILYNDETFEMVLKFNDGSKYTYFGVDFELFRNIFEGNAVCRTSGESKWGSWEVGKSPSVGAAVYTYLVENNVPYVRGGSLK